MTRGLVAVLACLVVLPTAHAASRSPVRLDGALALAAVPLASCMRVDAADAKVVECEAAGRFAGRPRTARRASYVWHWHLWHGGETPQTARGDEDGLLTLVFPDGTLGLKLRGAKTSGQTTGTWRYWKGTKRYAGRRGSGTFRFVTTASQSGFANARLVVRGALR